MKIVRRVLFGILILLVALVVFIGASILVDRWLGRDRLAALTNTSIPNPSGPQVRAYVARPTTAGPHPAIIMIHEFWGLNPDILAKAEDLAQAGYFVVAPDVFRGTTSTWVPSAIYQAASTPQSQINADLGAVFDWLSAQPDVHPERIAVMGFCFGGGASLQYSLVEQRLAATLVFYGQPVSDANRLRSLSGPLLGIYGGSDITISTDSVAAFETALGEAGVSNEITIYPDQPHAFVTMEAIRQGGAARQAWDQAQAFLGQALGDSSSGMQPVPPAQVANATPWGYLLSLGYAHTFGMGAMHH